MGARRTHPGPVVKGRHGARDWLSLIGLTVMWGSAFMLTKVAVSALEPDLVVAGRLAVACLILVPLVLMRRWGRLRPAWGGRVWLFMVLIAIFGNVLPFSLISWGQTAIDSALAGILMAVMPLATLGLAHFFVPGERLTPYRIGGFVLGFIGVVVLLGPDALLGIGDPGGALLPMLAVLAGAISYAVSAILARLRPPSAALPTAAATMVIASGLMLPSVARDASIHLGTLPGWAPLGAVLALGVFSTALAGIVYFGLVKEAGPAFVSQLNYLIPLWAVVMGVAFLGEKPAPQQLYALILILGGILVTRLEGRRLPPRGKASGYS